MSLKNWPVLLCLIFIVTIITYAGDQRADVIIALAVPIVFAGFYFLSLARGAGEDKGKDDPNNPDLLTRLGSYWLKLTMPRKTRTKSNKREDKSATGS